MNIAIYTNILTPYRKFFYDSLYKECKKNGDNFNVLLMAETEPNRKWKYNDLKTEYTILLQNKTFVRDEIYIHFNKNLRQVLEELKLDILICAGSYLCPGIWWALNLEKKLGYKTYFWSESHLNEEKNYSSLKVKIRDFIRKIIYRKFDGFWYAGELSKKFIERYSKIGADMYFMPNLIEESKYETTSYLSKTEKNRLRSFYKIEKDKIVFICPARLSKVKGIDKFLSIFARSYEKNKVIILIAGEGELKEDIECQIKKLDIDVRLLGFQNQKSIIELYGISDVFLLPSLSDPNPLTCIEALWSGLPLLISEHCGNYPEVVKQGENGYVFSYKDEAKILEYLNLLINSDENWKINASNISKKIAKEKYLSKLVVENLINYYHI